MSLETASSNEIQQRIFLGHALAQLIGEVKGLKGYDFYAIPEELVYLKDPYGLFVRLKQLAKSDGHPVTEYKSYRFRRKSKELGVDAVASDNGSIYLYGNHSEVTKSIFKLLHEWGHHRLGHCQRPAALDTPEKYERKEFQAEAMAYIVGLGLNLWNSRSAWYLLGEAWYEDGIEGQKVRILESLYEDSALLIKEGNSLLTYI